MFSVPVLAEMNGSSSVAPDVDGLPVGLTPFFVVVLILVLAGIWRFGIRLQEDVAATV